MHRLFGFVKGTSKIGACGAVRQAGLPASARRVGKRWPRRASVCPRCLPRGRAGLLGGILARLASTSSDGTAPRHALPCFPPVRPIVHPGLINFGTQRGSACQLSAAEPKAPEDPEYPEDAKGAITPLLLVTPHGHLCQWLNGRKPCLISFSLSAKSGSRPRTAPPRHGRVTGASRSVSHGVSRNTGPPSRNNSRPSARAAHRDGLLVRRPPVRHLCPPAPALPRTPGIGTCPSARVKNAHGEHFGESEP